MLSKEDPIFSSLSHKLGRNVDEVGHRIHQALLRVSVPNVMFFKICVLVFMCLVACPGVNIRQSVLIVTS